MKNYFQRGTGTGTGWAAGHWCKKQNHRRFVSPEDVWKRCRKGVSVHPFLRTQGQKWHEAHFILLGYSVWVIRVLLKYSWHVVGANQHLYHRVKKNIIIDASRVQPTAEEHCNVLFMPLLCMPTGIMPILCSYPPTPPPSPARWRYCCGEPLGQSTTKPVNIHTW